MTAEACEACQENKRLRGALAQLEHAVSAMLTGISVHNASHPEARARRDNIAGPVVTALSHSHARARAALAATPLLEPYDWGPDGVPQGEPFDLTQAVAQMKAGAEAMNEAAGFLAALPGYGKEAGEDEETV